MTFVKVHLRSSAGTTTTGLNSEQVVEQSGHEVVVKKVAGDWMANQEAEDAETRGLSAAEDNNLRNI